MTSSRPRLVAILFAVPALVFALSGSARAGASVSCDIVFQLDTDDDFFALQYEVDYSATGGGMNGIGGGVLCTNKLSGAMHAADDDDGTQTLTLGNATTQIPFSGPVELASCKYSGPDQPLASEFVITEIDSHDDSLATAGGNVCGAPLTGSTPPFARDAMAILQAATGAISCPLCECDLNGVNGVEGIDALTALKLAVGNDDAIPGCPECVGPAVPSVPSASASVSALVYCCGNGVVEPGEQCDDGNLVSGDCCHSDCTNESPGNFCDNGDECGGDACGQDGICVGGTDASACDDGNPCTRNLCSGSCFYPEEPEVSPICLFGGREALSVADSSDNTRDQIKWKLANGPEISQESVGTPTSTTDYTVCVYDHDGAASLVTRIDIPAGGNWTDKDPKGVLYKDPSGAADGVTKLLVKAGANGTTKMLLKAKGMNVPVPGPVSMTEYFALNPKMTIQLRHSSSEFCLQGEFGESDDVKLNTPETFKAKN